MSWLDFANHFLSNQRLHARSWINRTFLGNWVLLVGNLALSFLAFFFSIFVLREANKSPAHKILVGNLREKTTLGRGFLSFFLFIWWQFCIVQISSGPTTFLHISSIFLRSLIGNFLSFLFFLLFLNLCLGIFSSCFLLRARIDILTLGQGLWYVGISAQGL